MYEYRRAAVETPVQYTGALHAADPKDVEALLRERRTWALMDPLGDGTTSFRLFADIRTATNGPSGTERCGRVAIVVARGG
ncbi:hypothetical protein [Streptomyces sp.]|uniref:hypothetical protein n=1 Tax=Streptomyces sp. TaxID=1931 RepID=UPI002F95218A